ncbi:hypothetical protein hmeg3_17610 [Herbaspirillum sp. meg3]|uniref:hypothetical protein n=1 Tax=Herbaspirillum sp. meg3 TaxID=2025949 RepID=UPI000B998921|nr:hypothetical protein [Herbaspirillum sp. meg3]ASU39925.1 hypothetical protein hmeg3_17610 [Herbaspirillum sp. meg3]
MSQSSADNSIPLLTEVIATPAAAETPPPAPASSPNALYWEDAPGQPPIQTYDYSQPQPPIQLQPDYHQHYQPEQQQYQPSQQPVYQPTFDAPPLPVPVSPPLPATAPIPTTEQLQQLRQEIQDNIMQKMLGQVDNVLHQHLQDHLAVILDNMADILKTRVRASLEQALAESVTQALAEEMAKFENAKY